MNCCGPQGVRNASPEVFILLTVSSGTLAKGDAWHSIWIKENVRNETGQTNIYRRKDRTKGISFSINACMTSSMYSGTVGQQLVPKEI